MKLTIIAAVAIGQFLPDAEQQHLKQFWPKGVEFPANGRFYHVKQAYQLGDGAMHSPHYNVAALPDPGKTRATTPGNANREFPWGFPAGLHKATGWSSYKLLALPPGKSIRWWYENTTGFSSIDPARVIKWEYPVGTTFMEMLLTKDKAGDDWCFEVRERHKGDSGWEYTAYRPKLSEAQPVKRVVSGGSTAALGLGSQIEVDLLDVSHLEPRSLWNATFYANERAGTATVHGAAVPKDYLGNVTTCTNCHKQTLTHVSRFDAKLSGPKREWYGFSRGSDQTVSHHIFDESCISTNGMTQQVRFNKQLPIERK